MAELVLKMRWYPSQDVTYTAVDEVTLDYLEDGNGGWGVDGTNPNRADRCLVFWAEFLELDGTTTLIQQITDTNDTDGVVGIADGVGLANTDTTRFKITYKEGTQTYYLLPVVRDVTRVSGTLGDIYFNTDDSKVYYHDGVGYQLLTKDYLDDLKIATGIKICTAFLYAQFRVILNSKVRKLKPLEYEDDKDRARRRGIREMKNKMLSFKAAALEGNYLTASKLLNTATDESTRL